MVIKNRLMDVQFDLVVQNFRELFTKAGIIKFHKPYVNQLQCVIYVVSTMVSPNDFIDRRHDHGEHRDAKELHKHSEYIFE